MVVKAVEMVRKIRDKHYEETEGMAVEERINFIKHKSEKLQKRLTIDEISLRQNGIPQTMLIIKYTVKTY